MDIQRPLTNLSHLSGGAQQELFQVLAWQGKLESLLQFQGLMAKVVTCYWTRLRCVQSVSKRCPRPVGAVFVFCPGEKLQTLNLEALYSSSSYSHVMRCCCRINKQVMLRTVNEYNCRRRTGEQKTTINDCHDPVICLLYSTYSFGLLLAKSI